MYYGDKVYFVSDRDRTTNLFVYDTKTKQTQKLTDFKEFDNQIPFAWRRCDSVLKMADTFTCMTW
jgi:tricorn protease